MFDITKDSDGNEVLSMSEVNKYSYHTEDNDTMDSAVVEFEPLPSNDSERCGSDLLKLWQA